MIIGLVGKKRVGKDTAADYLVKQYGFERVASADKLKESVAALLNIPLSEVEKLKNDLTTYLAVGRFDEDGLLIPYSVMQPLTFREVLQRYGDESHRQVFGDQFWIDLSLPVEPFGVYGGRKIVISDVRYESEAARIKLLGGMLIRIQRHTGSVSDGHGSETEQDQLDVPLRIINSGTISDLYSCLDDLMANVRV